SHIAWLTLMNRPAGMAPGGVASVSVLNAIRAMPTGAPSNARRHRRSLSRAAVSSGSWRCTLLVVGWRPAWGPTALGPVWSSIYYREWTQSPLSQRRTAKAGSCLPTKFVCQLRVTMFPGDCNDGVLTCCPAHFEALSLAEARARLQNEAVRGVCDT